MFNPFSALTSKIYGVVVIAALTFGAIQTARIDGFLFIDGYVDKLEARDATIAAMIKASDEAKAAQVAMNKAVTDKQTDIARKADNAPTDIIDRGRAFADRMRAGTYCRKADSPAESGAAPSGHPASDTAFVPVPRDDFDILVANTARLVKVKTWSDDLIAEGLAVPVE